VGPVTAEDVVANPRLAPNSVIGKFGLERAYEDLLTGTSTKQIFEITALGKKNRLVRTDLGNPGSSLSTTLDPFLMTVSAQAMGNHTGAVVIQDSATGAVLALVSTPNFDPNLMVARESDPQKERERKRLVSEFYTHPKQLFFNRAVGGAYPPGSVFKLITALAGLESGKLDENTSVVDEGILKVGEYSYANWYFSQYGRTEGTVTLQKAISRSNDIYFYKAAEWMGPNKLSEFAKLFGYGSKTGIELSGETAGFVPSPAWKEEQQGEKWYLGNTYHFGIGQGDVLVSPMQVSQATQAIANHGVICPPSLLPMNAKQCKGLGVSEEHLESVVSGMIAACSAGGTAFPFFEWNTQHELAAGGSAESGVSESTTGGSNSLSSNMGAYQRLRQSIVGCKTGTAEFGVNTAADKKKTHGWFTMILNTDSLLQSPAASAAAALWETGGSQVANVAGGASNMASESGQVAGVQIGEELGIGGPNLLAQLDPSLDSSTATTSASTTVQGVGSAAVTETATSAAALAQQQARRELHIPDFTDYPTWIHQLKKTDFPQQITITILVESDEENPYREGSKDAAPVAKALVDWMSGKPLKTPTPVVPPPGVAAE
jgi:cell division protein FtsI/penicillin-binding protein 2